MMQVKDIMTDSVFAFQQDCSMDVVCDLLVVEGLGSVPVVGSDYRFCGVVVSNDLMKLALGSREEESFFSEGQFNVSDVMRREVLSVSPEDSLEKALVAYLENGVGSLPVVVEGLLVGMVMEKELLSLLVHISANRNRECSL